MVLLDSNVFIYLSNGKIKADKIAGLDIGYASISKIETLGFPNIQANEQLLLNSLLEEAYSFALSDSIVNQAIKLRQLKKLSLGDAIVAATALENNLTLWTANTDDFKHIEDIKLHNPIV